ncbi:hypothetical protein D3C71_1576330 [compost metagenome]
MPNQAASVPTNKNGTQIQAAFSNHSELPSGCCCAVPPNAPKTATDMTSGATNCITLTPRLPNPPFRPKAPPCLALGKKKLILAMLEAKLAPAKPHSNEIMTNTPYGVVASCTAKPSHRQGTSRKQVLMAVQRRPPNIGITNE